MPRTDILSNAAENLHRRGDNATPHPPPPVLRSRHSGPAPGASAATWSGVRAQAPGAGASGLAAASRGPQSGAGGRRSPGGGFCGTGRQGGPGGSAPARQPGGPGAREVGLPGTRQPWARDRGRVGRSPALRSPVPPEGAQAVVGAQPRGAGVGVGVGESRLPPVRALPGGQSGRSCHPLAEGGPMRLRFLLSCSYLQIRVHFLCLFSMFSQAKWLKMREIETL